MDLGIIVFILGLTNIISLLLVLFSCRCVMNKTYFVNLISKSELYHKFYSYHCYYWWVFITSVIMHVIIALYVYGIPF